MSNEPLLLSISMLSMLVGEAGASGGGDVGLIMPLLSLPLEIKLLTTYAVFSRHPLSITES